jgi:lipoate-protein ligase B
VACRQEDQIRDTLVLVEHPHVITIGRRAGAAANILEHGGIPVFEIERGGDVTYHGPGQLVGYPLLQLSGPARDLHRYLRELEEVMVRTCRTYGVPAERKDGATGAWIEDRKLASIGVAVKRWVTLHGFALNVSTDLARFSAINPCGFQASVMTSLERETGRRIGLDQVKRDLVRHFREVFQKFL